MAARREFRGLHPTRLFGSAVAAAFGFRMLSHSGHGMIKG